MKKKRTDPTPCYTSNHLFHLSPSLFTYCWLDPKMSITLLHYLHCSHCELHYILAFSPCWSYKKLLSWLLPFHKNYIPQKPFLIFFFSGMAGPARCWARTPLDFWFLRTKLKTLLMIFRFSWPSSHMFSPTPLLILQNCLLHHVSHWPGVPDVFTTAILTRNGRTNKGYI